MNKLFLIALVVTSFNAFSQATEPIKPALLFEKSSGLYQEEKFPEALKELEKIDRNDTSYADALIQRASIHAKLEDYESAVKLCHEGIGLHTEEEITFYINKAYYLNQAKKYDDALAVIATAQKIYPNNYLLYYNKGTAYKGLKKNQDALAMFKESIKCKPFYPYGHLQLGFMAAEEGKTTKAMLALNMFLILLPENPNSLQVLEKLNQIVSSPYDGTPSNINLSPEGGDDFSEIDLVINNYVALGKDYKVPIKSNSAIIKQNYALLNTLQYDSNDKGFWMQTYGPFFKEMMKRQLFEGFSYHILKSSKNEIHIKLVNKNKAAIDAFTSWAVPNIDKIQSVRTTVLNGKKGEYNCLYDNSTHCLFGIGKFDEQKNHYNGYFEVYNSNGALKAKGVLNENGEKNGLWSFYYSTGELSEQTNYVNGKPDGSVKWFTKDSLLMGEKNFSNGKENGNYKKYSSGLLYNQTMMKDGAENGKVIDYYLIGEKFKHFEGKYAQNVITDTLYEYYDNGALASTRIFANNMKNGDEKVYYRNGKLEVDLKNLNGLNEGDYKAYHADGSIRQTGQYKAGKQIGTWKKYYPGGVLESEMVLNEKGKSHGISKVYDTDGKLYNEFEYSNGEIIGYKYYNKQGAVIKEDRKKKGEFEFVGYYPEGMKQMEGVYTVNGKVGIWKYYDRFGVMYQEEFYNNNGQLHGELKNYYSNGKLHFVGKYANGEESGYYVSYHMNGKISSEGWLREDKKVGYWNNYYQDGTILSKLYYDNDKLVGYQEYYSVTGKLNKEEYYTRDNVQTKEIDYDSLGNVEEQIILKNGTGEFVDHFNNGKVKFRGNYIQGVAHGKFEWFIYNGSPATSGSYYNGQRHGNWKFIDEDGILTSEGEFSYGNEVGKWVYYHPNKKIRKVTYFEDGLRTGEEIQYYDNGQIEIKRTFVRDKAEGKAYYYDELGELQMIRNYHEDNALSCTYYDKNGQLIEPINLVSPSSYDFQSFYKNGNKSREYKFENGIFHGKYVEYFSNGKVSIDKSYSLEELDGPYKEYFLNGILKEESTYDFGELNGTFKNYYANGKLKSELNYKSGKRHGICKFYVDGKLVKTITYYSGNIVKETTF